MLIEIKGIDKVLGMTDSKNIDTAAVRAINRTMTVARTASLKHTREEWNVKASTLKSYTKIERASRTNKTATFRIVSNPIPLIEFAARQTRKGVTYKIKRKAGRQLLRHAFLATMRDGRRGVYKRKTKKRLPIVEQTVITPTSMFGQESDEVFKKTFEERVNARFWHELNRLIR